MICVGNGSWAGSHSDRFFSFYPSSHCYKSALLTVITVGHTYILSYLTYNIFTFLLLTLV